MHQCLQSQVEASMSISYNIVEAHAYIRVEWLIWRLQLWWLFPEFEHHHNCMHAMTKMGALATAK